MPAGWWALAYVKHHERFFDALIVGQHEGADLIYKEKVRFGFDDAMKRRLLSDMEPFRVPECPFRNPSRAAPKRCARSSTDD
jgi:hypothetical protein